MVELIANVNSAVNGFVWGVPMLVLLVGTGILMTILTKFFQLSHLGHWFKNTVGGIFHDEHVTKHTEAGDQSISQFQSLCTALAATIGTGNIVGVASALVAGGPGAIFWMWVVAFFGMMTNYSENVLGIYYRRRNSKGEWSGGAMYYLKDGLGSYKGCKQIGAVLAVLFSAFCLLASFGIGNMSQVNSIAANMTSAFSIPATATGIVLVIIGALVHCGRIKADRCCHRETGSFYGHRLCHRCAGDLLRKYRSRWGRIHRNIQRSFWSARRGRRYRRLRSEAGSDLGHEAWCVL